MSRFIALLLLVCAAPAAAAEGYRTFLVPVLYQGPGAHGSYWYSELWAFNDASIPADLQPALYNMPCPLAAPCPGPTPPKTVAADFIFRDFPEGMFIYAPENVAAQQRFTARITEVSRPGGNWGTALPVVHENDFSSDSLHLFKIATSDRFRVSLRIYGRSTTTSLARVSLTDSITRAVITELTVPVVHQHRGAWVEPHLIRTPAHAQIADLAALLPAMRTGMIDVTVTSEDRQVPLWAMVTVTHNETQHVTVVTP
jgi:hypothetical protein